MTTPCDLPGWLDLRRQAPQFPLRFQGDFPNWQARVRAAWQLAVPPAPLPEVAQHGAQVTFRFASGAAADGCLRLPPGPGPHPAVLLLHDHGGAFDRGWQKMFAATADAAALERHYGGQAPGDALLAAGFAVLCLDAFGWGARQAGGYDGQQALAAAAIGLGTSLAGIVAAEDAQAVQWLATHPAVDAGRIGAFGFSFGGFRAWQVAALAPQVRATASLGWMARRMGLMAPGAPLLRGQSAFWMLHPALCALMDFPDMAGAGAGKPLFLRSGDADPHMPRAAVQGAFADLAAVWQAAGAASPDMAMFAGGHVCPPAVQDQAIAFLRHHLA